MRYPKEVVLKEGGEACLRLLERDDMEPLCHFYREFPESDRWYMRYDPLDPEAVRKWFDDLERGDTYAIIALMDDRIIGHISLRCWEYGCIKHVGRIHIMILPQFRHRRLGTWLLLDVIQLAMDKKIECLRADFVTGIEDAAVEAATRLDFFKAARLPHYVKDLDGNFHDMQIMIKQLHKHWSDF